FMGVGILAHGFLDALDQRIDALAALLSQELGRMAEPARIGRTSADRQRGPRSAKVRVYYLVDDVGSRAGRLDRDPSVDAEIAQPARAARAVDLDDGLGCRGGVRGQAHAPRAEMRSKTLQRAHSERSFSSSG